MKFTKLPLYIVLQQQIFDEVLKHTLGSVLLLNTNSLFFVVFYT
jgi:hypothetical protein